MIRLVGRWYINAIMSYLHTTPQTFTLGISARMVQHKDYALITPAHGDLNHCLQTLGLYSACFGF